MVGKKITLLDIPTITEKVSNKIRNRYDVNALADIFKEFPAGSSFAVLEKSTAMPGQGVTSMFSIGLGFGMYQGILSMQRISYEIVHPKRWQKEFHIHTDTKSQAFQIASRLFPEAEMSTPRGRILTGRSDSILMCEWARRKHTGTLEVK